MFALQIIVLRAVCVQLSLNCADGVTVASLWRQLVPYGTLDNAPWEKGFSSVQAESIHEAVHTCCTIMHHPNDEIIGEPLDSVWK